MLTQLAGSGNQMVQLGTLMAVVIGGVGNFWQTEQLSEQSLRDREKAVKEIHQLYERVDEFEARQLKSLANQNIMMESNSEQLRILREGQVQFLQRQQKLFPQGP